MNDRRIRAVVAGVGRDGAGDTPVRMSERTLQDAIVECAGVLGWRVFHPWTSVNSAAGYPDLTLTRGGRLIYAELKVGRNRPTAEQMAWLGALGAVPGIEVYLWREHHWLSGEIERLLRGDAQ